MIKGEGNHKCLLYFLSRFAFRFYVGAAPYWSLLLFFRSFFIILESKNSKPLLPLCKKTTKRRTKPYLLCKARKYSRSLGLTSSIILFTIPPISSLYIFCRGKGNERELTSVTSKHQKELDRVHHQYKEKIQHLQERLDQTEDDLQQKNTVHEKTATGIGYILHLLIPPPLFSIRITFPFNQINRNERCSTQISNDFNITQERATGKRTIASASRTKQVRIQLRDSNFLGR